MVQAETRRDPQGVGRQGNEQLARILLAEDDNSLRPYLARALRRDGHDVVSVRDGMEALMHLGPGKFDLLLADIVMPELDGIELARRAEREDPAIRVMFITGFAAVAMQSHRESKHAAKVLSKPFHLKDVVAEVKILLEGEDLTVVESPPDSKS